MAKHELTEKQIAALQKLGVANFGFYRAHIPISMNNIYFNTYGKAFDRLSKAIAVDVYTSPIGKNRFRECYDCFKKLNKRGKLGNTEVFLRLLDERAQYYFGILCGTIKSATSIHITPPAASKKTTDVQLTAKQKKQHFGNIMLSFLMLIATMRTEFCTVRYWLSTFGTFYNCHIIYYLFK